MIELENGTPFLITSHFRNVDYSLSMQAEMDSGSYGAVFGVVVVHL